MIGALSFPVLAPLEETQLRPDMAQNYYYSQVYTKDRIKAA